MGLNIDRNNNVMFDDTHQRRVDTSLDKNPSKGRVGNVDLRFVFRRNRTGDLDRDGNPLIYALKGMNGYGIVDFYRRKFFKRAEDIVNVFAHEVDADFVMPVPSGYSFCSEFAEELSGWLGLPFLSPDFLDKKTVGEALADAKANPVNIKNKRTKRLYTSQLYQWQHMDSGQHVAMKELDKKIRGYVRPMKLIGDTSHLAEKKVLIVDDLMSSGTSIRCAAELLQSQGVEVNMGVFFLSGL
ncbi:phosphoribosyltransferase [Ruegeria atlantica]|uniref:phosphoribosyltransferase n=1 Tax=Ruegeria atlantica TaxID=81569 RepID=UPI002493FD87|nr:phosphoribosyltransferase family protein [Ruegeria atlantica]